MRESIRRALAGLLAVLLVSSTVSPVGVAAANHKCTGGDVTLGLALTGGAEVKDAIFNTNSSEELDGKDEDGSELFGCDLFHGTTDTDSLNDVDNAEAKEGLISRAAVSAQHARDKLAAWNNTVQGLENQARNDALAAYGRALEDNATEANATARAKQAVEDFYAVRESQLITDWNTLALSWLDYRNKSQTEGLPSNFVAFDPEQPMGMADRKDSTATLPDGSTKNAIGIETAGGSNYAVNPWGARDSLSELLYVGANNESLETAVSPEPYDFVELKEELNGQVTNVKNNVETYIDETYTAYHDGKITWAQAVGASTIARNFAMNGSFQSWAITRLSNMEGVGPPENMSSVGYFDVTHGNHTTRGMLVSDSNPASGAFEAGQTYNGSALEGPTYLVSNSSVESLDGQFTINEITGTDGEQIEKTVVKNITYTTSNTTELQEILETNQELRAELDAREHKLQNRTGGGGGLFDFNGLAGSLPFGGAGVVAALGAIVVLGLVTRN